MTTNTDLHGAMPELPDMPSNIIHVTRRIRACESEVPAQLVLEYAMREYARAAIQQAAGAVPEGLIACLRGGAQCDEDGTNIIMSREACCVAADILERIATPAPPKQQPAVGRGDGGGVKVPLNVSVFHLGEGDDPFVCRCNGMVTASVLADIDRALKANEGDYFPDGPGTYEFNLTWFSGQYGFEGRCELVPGWEFESTGFDPLPFEPAPRPSAPTGQINPDSAGQGMEGGE